MAGKNDILQGNSIKKEFANKLFNRLKHTNVCICSIPFSDNKPILNRLIYEANVLLYNAAMNYKKSITFFDVNKILNRQHFQRYGIHMNNNGKIFLCRYLINAFQRYRTLHNTRKTTNTSFICESNLIVIIPTEGNSNNICIPKSNTRDNNNYKIYPLLPPNDDDLHQFLVQDSSISRDKETIQYNHNLYPVLFNCDSPFFTSESTECF